MRSLNDLLNKIKNIVRNLRLDLHFKKELQEVKKKSKLDFQSLQPNESDEVKQFYKKYGFNKINLRWHEYLFAATGKCYKEYIPENLYHCVIEPIYTRGSSDLEDKAYMQRMLPGVKMVPNIIKNVRGVFLDEYDNILSIQSVIDRILSSNNDLIIKPSRNTGGGAHVKKIKVGRFDKSILEEFKQDYVIQECILQHPQYEEFNSSSVNTEKIISFLFKDNVYILTSILRVGAPGACTDTASTGYGYTVGIGTDGRLNDKGYNIYGDVRYKNANGKKFSDIKLVGHEAICNIILSAHKMLPRFGIISWDFAVDKCGDPILIEYNLNYPDVMIYQMNNGPLFGNLTEEVLLDVKKKMGGKQWD